jgi:anti-anti-sigma factor
MLTINKDNEEKKITITFKGRMDSLATVNLSENIHAEPVVKEMKPEERLVFDLKEVDYIASSFIRTCVNCSKVAGSDRFSIVNCQPFVKKTFKISGLDGVLNIT